MSGAVPVRMFSAFDIVGFEYGGRRIWWFTDEAQPTYSVPTVDGREVSAVVANPAFAVQPGPAGLRRTAMRRAAQAFFAPVAVAS